MPHSSKLIGSSGTVRTGSSGYLDTATYGLPPQETLDVLHACLDEWQQGKGDWIEWEAIGGQCRALFAELVRCDPASIALLPSVSQATAVAVSTVPDGGQIVLAEGDFASVVLPVLASAQSRGIHVRRAPLGQLQDSITPGTDLVAVSHAQSSSGELVDVAGIVAAANGIGARVYLDATQALGVVPLDAPSAGVAFVSCAAYKWLCCPRGVAFLYVAEPGALLPPPAAASWRGARSPYEAFYPTELDLSPTASRYDLPLAWHLWVAARSSLRELVAIGDQARFDRATTVARRITDGLGMPYPQSGIVSVPVTDPVAALAALRAADVRASVRNSSVRLSPHYYNDVADADRAVDVLSPLIAPQGA